jgi:hypothetical protein
MFMLVGQPKPGDLEIVERRRENCIFASIPGWYALVDHGNARGDRREFSCRAVNISERAIALSASVTGNLGERVTANIDRLGKIEGVIIGILSRGFVMSIRASQQERSRLSDRIEWIEKHKNHDVPDQRAHSRFVPKDPSSRLVFADGTVTTCHVIDLSEAGAAISADLDPEFGTVLAIGAIIGRVVRRFDGGFALQFLRPHSRDSVEVMAIVND